MKMRLSIWMLIIVVNYSACSQKIVAVPGCIQQRIAAIKQQPRWNPPAEINEYTYQGKKVYLVSADCCDQFITLVDENCKYLCAPAGGITGKGDRKCVDFNDKATFVRVVWKDERK